MEAAEPAGIFFMAMVFPETTAVPAVVVAVNGAVPEVTDKVIEYVC
jgi:hypothetical protein